MLLSDLLEEKRSPDIEARDLVKDLRAIAKERYLLTLDTSGTNASNGFPLVRKSGTWYGAKFLPLGGAKVENKRIEAGELAPIKVRALAFCKEIGSQLEMMAKSGRTIKLSNDISYAVIANRYERLPEVDPASITSALKRLLADSRDLSVYWWVAAPASDASETMVNLNIEISNADDRSVKPRIFTFYIPSKQARAIVDATKVHNSNIRVELSDALAPEIRRPTFGIGIGRPPNASIVTDISVIHPVIRHIS